MSSLLAEAINGQRGDGQCLTAGQLTRPLSEWISRFERDASQQGAVLAILNTMPDATPSYWNLTQAIAWVVFRNLSVTNRFGEPKTEDWSAYMQYPSMWPTSADDEAEEPRTAPIPGDDKERLEQRAILYASMQDNAKKKVDEFREAPQTFFELLACTLLTDRPTFPADLCRALGCQKTVVNKWWKLGKIVMVQGKT